MTTLGIVFSFLLGSNVLVEKVFWPGIGSFAIEALVASDYAPVQGFVLSMALLYVLLNLSIDIAYGFVDPRHEDPRTDMSAVWQKRLQTLRYVIRRTRCRWRPSCSSPASCCWR